MAKKDEAKTDEAKTDNLFIVITNLAARRGPKTWAASNVPQDLSDIDPEAIKVLLEKERIRRPTAKELEDYA